MESVYKFIELIGVSTESWEKAAATAVERASQTLRDIRIAEIEKLDMQLENNVGYAALDINRVVAYRAKVKISFKVEKAVNDE